MAHSPVFRWLFGNWGALVTCAKVFNPLYSIVPPVRRDFELRYLKNYKHYVIFRTAHC